MSLHDDIMNLRCDTPKDANVNQAISFKYGHKQARHAAAELAKQADTEIERLHAENRMLQQSLEEAVNIHRAMFSTAREVAADAVKEMRSAAEYLVVEGVAPVLRDYEKRRGCFRPQLVLMRAKNTTMTSKLHNAYIGDDA